MQSECSPRRQKSQARQESPGLIITRVPTDTFSGRATAVYAGPDNYQTCQSASKRDPLSACNRDPLLVFGMDVTSAPLARVGA